MMRNDLRKNMILIILIMLLLGIGQIALAERFNVNADYSSKIEKEIREGVPLPLN